MLRIQYLKVFFKEALMIKRVYTIFPGVVNKYEPFTLDPDEFKLKLDPVYNTVCCSVERQKCYN